MEFMRLLVLGGTRFVGRAVVEAALDGGHQVTTVNRGLSGSPAAGVHVVTADRTDKAALQAAIGAGEWDAAIDTWSGAPRVAADACDVLAGRTGHYGYVSSVSVYQWPIPVGTDENTPVVDADPDSDSNDDYAAAKRGAELAVLRAFGDRALLARAGLILGPYENVGRLPWWLRRIERGGRVLAPGDPAQPIQYIDARDLAAWLLTAAQQRTPGAFNAVGLPGGATMGELLTAALTATGSDAELTWVDQQGVLDAGIEPWTELPIWLPRGGEYEGMTTVNVTAAHAAGLTDRPIQDTVAATWAWLQAEGDPKPRNPPGVAPEKERQVLDNLQAR
jgi:nucleoside-diphosphate-sugar epimerase